MLNSPTILIDPTGLKMVPTGVYVGEGYIKGSCIWNPYGMSCHSFIVSSGKGYGRFERNKNAIGSSVIRTDDLKQYPHRPSSETPKGESYSILYEVYIDDEFYNLREFKDGVRGFIRDQLASSGGFCVMFKDCDTFTYGALGAGLTNGAIPGKRPIETRPGHTLVEVKPPQDDESEGGTKK